MQITICYRWVAQNNLLFIMKNLFFVPPGNAPTILCSIYIRKKNQSGLCPSRAQCPLMPNFCSWVTRKSNFFHSNHMLDTLDFTGSEHWAPFKFPWSAPCVSHIFPTSSPKLCLYNDGWWIYLSLIFHCVLSLLYCCQLHLQVYSMCSRS